MAMTKIARNSSDGSCDLLYTVGFIEYTQVLLASLTAPIIGAWWKPSNFFQFFPILILIGNRFIDWKPDPVNRIDQTVLIGKAEKIGKLENQFARVQSGLPNAPGFDDKIVTPCDLEK